MTIPLIDFSLPDEEASKQLGKACREIGFFAIINHGIDKDLIKEVFGTSRQIFQLPDEVKNQHKIRPDNRGFSSHSTEQLDPTSKQKDNKECFNFVPDEGYDDFHSPESAPDPEKLDEKEKKEFEFRWPAEAPKSTRHTMLTYIREVMVKLNDRLHRLFAMDLGLENKDFFKPYFEQPQVTLRLLRYPALSKEDLENYDEKDPIISAGAHSDYDAVTYLVVSGVAGLQVQHRESKEWIEPPAFQAGEAIIVNIADLMMRWTNDLYKSTLHRVLAPKQERYSCALFVGPKGDTVVEALPGTGEPKYEKVTANEHLMQKLAATYDYTKQ
jgi:isopenicillin N synthase-like dioxygenase